MKRKLLTAFLAVASLFTIVYPANAVGPNSSAVCASSAIKLNSQVMNAISGTYGLARVNGAYTLPSGTSIDPSLGCTTDFSVAFHTEAPQDVYLSYANRPSDLFSSSTDRTVSMTFTGTAGAGGWYVAALDLGATSQGQIKINQSSGGVPNASPVESWPGSAVEQTITYEWTLTEAQYQHALLGNFIVEIALLGGSSGAGTPDTIRGAINASVFPDATVFFDGNGGIGVMSSQTSNIASNLTANTFSRSGYVFAGWNTHQDGSGAAFADSASYDFTAGGGTLFAQWNQVPTSISSPSAGGSEDSSGQLASTGHDLNLYGGLSAALVFVGFWLLKRRGFYKLLKPSKALHRRN